MSAPAKIRITLSLKMGELELVAVAIRQDPQHREEFRPALDLVDDDRTVQRPERRRGIREAREVSRILQVEGRGGPCRRGAISRASVVLLI